MLAGDEPGDGIKTLLSASGVTVMAGEAVLAASGTAVCVNGEQYAADDVIIATGSESKTLPIENLDEEMVCDSTWLLNTEQLPRRICIVGAGVIGMEFASILCSFGCEVSVVEYLKECLPSLDSDIAKRLRKCLEKRGVKFYMQSALKYAAGGKVAFERKGKEVEIE